MCLFLGTGLACPGAGLMFTQWLGLLPTALGSGFVGGHIFGGNVFRWWVVVRWWAVTALVEAVEHKMAVFRYRPPRR